MWQESICYYKLSSSYSTHFKKTALHRFRQHDFGAVGGVVTSFVLREEHAACWALLGFVGTYEDMGRQIFALAAEATRVGTLDSHQFTVL